MEKFTTAALILLGMTIFNTSVMAEVNFTVQTSISQQGKPADVYENSLAAGSILDINAGNRYQLTMHVSEAHDDKALLDITLQSNGVVQTPKLLGEYGKAVGFEVDGTAVYFVVNKSG